MNEFDWRGFLAAWSRELIAAKDIAETLPPAVKASGWLGYPGAAEAEIARAEARLGVKLPPSYRAFLTVTNGWRRMGFFVDELWPAAKIDWFRVAHQEWIDDWNLGAGSAAAVGSDGRDLAATLQISDVGDSAVYLLNPKTISPDGEWQAWFFSNWNPGANRYRSFEAMMQAERKDFLFVRDRQRR